MSRSQKTINFVEKALFFATKKLECANECLKLCKNYRWQLDWNPPSQPR